MGEEEITQAGTVTIENALNQLPQFVQGQTQSTVGAVALAGRASLNLRGLGETRNLVLLDGRRLPLSNANGVVDVNLIPQFILDGVETITGGASAVYGSDAMSGVVNFKSRTDFEGMQFDGRYGMSEQGDANSMDVGVTAGFAIGEGKRQRAAVDRLHRSRSAVRKGPRLLPARRAVVVHRHRHLRAVADQPAQQAVINDVFATYGVAAGAVLNSRSLGINDNGTLFGQIGASNYQGPTSGYFSTIGGTVRQPVTYQEFVVNPMERKSFFGKFDYDVADAVDRVRPVPLQQDHGHRPGGLDADAVRGAHGAGHESVHSRDLRTILASRPTPGADFTINQRFMGLDTASSPPTSPSAQYILGLRGELPIKDWRWDIYGSYDTTDLVETQDKAILNSRMRNLLYAADGGASICAGGFNPFGLTATRRTSRPRAATIIESRRTTTRSSRQTIFEASVNGSLFALPAGDLQVRVHAGHARQRVRVRSRIRRARTSTSSARCKRIPAEGSTGVKEAALEFLIPLLSDKPFARRLDLDARLPCVRLRRRRPVETYKADGVWEPIKSLMFRGGFEHAIRAPNIGELYNQARCAGADRFAAGAGRSLRHAFVGAHRCEWRRRSRPVRRDRRAGSDRRHLSIHHGRDRRDQQRQSRT